MAGPPGALTSSTVTLYRPDVLALNQTAETLIPATPGVVNLPLRVMVQQNNAFYVNTSQAINFGYGSIGSPFSPYSVGLFWGSGLAKYLDDISFSQLTNTDASAVASQPYIAYAPAAMTESGGTGGDITFTVWYSSYILQ